jgi:hypothetical protein
MSPVDIKNAIHSGNLVSCTAEEYRDVRNQLHGLAGMYADQDDAVRMGIALSEVKRLDSLFDFKLQGDTFERSV